MRKYTSISNLCTSASPYTKHWTARRSSSEVISKTAKSALIIPSSAMLTAVQTQATLISTSRMTNTPETLMATMPLLMQELVGFFIIEEHVLRTLPDFRSQRDVDELWDEMCRQMVEVMGTGLKGCNDPAIFLETKVNVLLFVQTLEVRL